MRAMTTTEVGAAAPRAVRGTTPSWDATAPRPLGAAERLAMFLAAVSSTPDVTTAMLVAAQHAAHAFDAAFVAVTRGTTTVSSAPPIEDGCASTAVALECPEGGEIRVVRALDVHFSL